MPGQELIDLLCDFSHHRISWQNISSLVCHDGKTIIELKYYNKHKCFKVSDNAHIFSQQDRTPSQWHFRNLLYLVIQSFIYIWLFLSWFFFIQTPSSLELQVNGVQFLFSSVALWRLVLLWAMVGICILLFWKDTNSRIPISSNWLKQKFRQKVGVSNSQNNKKLSVE